MAGYKIWGVYDKINQNWRYFANAQDAWIYWENSDHRSIPNCIHIIIKADLLNLLNSLT